MSALAVLIGGILSLPAASDAGQQTETSPPQQSDSDSTANSDTDNTPAADGKSDAAVDLLNTDFEKQWSHYSSQQDFPLANVWMIRKARKPDDTVLVCTGEPKGFLFTRERFSNFELTFDWKYPKDPNGNSGILLYTQEDMRLWPTSIQIQLHQPKAGSIFPSGDAKSSNTSEVSDMAAAHNQWNGCKIASENGRVSVFINGKKVGEVSGCNPSAGSIAIQSEGSEVHFRKLKIKQLPDPLATELKPEDVEKPAVKPDADSDANQTPSA